MTTPTPEIRKATDEDLDAVTDIVNRANPWDAPTTVEVVRWAVGRFDSNRPHAHFVAEAQGGVVGIAFVRKAPHLQPLAFDIDVDPAKQRTGIGTQLFRRVIDVVRGEPRLVMLVSESSEGGLAFAAKNGFIERSRMFESELSLADFDPERFASSGGQQPETGIRFSTLAREDSPALRRALHGLTQEVSEDIPTPEPIPPLAYDEWEGDWIEGQLATPDLFVLAFSDERPVAFTQIFTTPDGTAYHRLTGVARDHRGRGLGLAVKAVALRMAKAESRACGPKTTHPTPTCWRSTTSSASSLSPESSVSTSSSTAPSRCKRAGLRGRRWAGEATVRALSAGVSAHHVFGTRGYLTADSERKFH